MPLFTFECRKCGSVFEALVTSRRGSDGTKCRSCDGAARRQPISRFSIGGRRATARSSALAATSKDFVSNSDSFVSAMDAFGEKVGSKLSDRQMDRAVERIKTMKR
jgi:putative FmdB family regulatory protein